MLQRPWQKKYTHDTYKSIENDILYHEDKKLSLPHNMPIVYPDDGSGIANTLKKNNAVYHKSCRDSIRPYRVAKKRHPGSALLEDIGIPKTKKAKRNDEGTGKSQCAYCQKDKKKALHQSNINSNCWRNMVGWALASKNWCVLSRLNAVKESSEAIFYHRNCYWDLRGDARRYEQSTTASNDRKSYDHLIMSQLVAYIKFQSATVKVADMMQLYVDKLEDVDSKWKQKVINSSRFKDTLLDMLGPDWSSHKHGKFTYIANSTNVAKAVKTEFQHQVTDCEADKIVEVALILRKYVLRDQTPFDGTFSPNCLLECTPRPLLTLIDVMLQGPQSICKGKGHQCQ